MYHKWLIADIVADTRMKFPAGIMKGLLQNETLREKKLHWKETL